jgi:hypothetical protein
VTQGRPLPLWLNLKSAVVAGQASISRAPFSFFAQWREQLDFRSLDNGRGEKEKKRNNESREPLRHAHFYLPIKDEGKPGNHRTPVIIY